MVAHKGEVECEVTTAKALDDIQKTKLEDTLKKFVTTDQKIRLTAHVSLDILGGMIVSIGDRFIDMSVRSKIKKYTDIMSIPV